MRNYLMHQLQNLFQVPVYKGHLEQDFKIPDLWSGLSKNVWSGESGFSTAQCDLQLHDSSVEVCDIIEALFPHVIEYWNTLGYAPAQIRPTASWANWHEAGDHTSEHSHCDGTRQTHIASVYYIEKGEGGDIELINPLDYIHRLTPLAGEQGDMLMSESIKCVSGDFLLFPGWLRHRTQITQSPRKALSINFNGYL